MSIGMSSLRLFLSLFLTLGLVLSCSLKEKKPTSPMGFYEKAIKYKEQGNHPKALETLTQLRQQFPYSSYSTKARLLLGDIYFDQKKYSLAADVYKRFSLLHPKIKTTYILNQLGLCYLHQLPSTPDRDISKADPALKYFQKLLDFPEENPYKAGAKKYKVDLLNLKAKKEFIISAFYIKRGWEEAAFNRLNHIISLYPESSVISKALLSAYTLAKKLNKDPEIYKNQLKKRFPHLLKPENQKEV